MGANATGAVRWEPSDWRSAMGAKGTGTVRWEPSDESNAMWEGGVRWEPKWHQQCDWRLAIERGWRGVAHRPRRQHHPGVVFRTKEVWIDQ